MRGSSVRASAPSGLFFLVLSLVAVSVGCGGGGGGGSSGGQRRFTVAVVGSDPADNATNVSVATSTIRVFFDRALDPSTVDATTVFVTEGSGTLVQGTVTYQSGTTEVTWTLAPGQNRNILLPGQDLLAFDEFYSISVTTGVRAATGAGLQGPFTATFRTSSFGYGAIAGSDPAPGATNALIDPFRVLVNGQVVEATLQFKIDIGLMPADVTATAGSPPNCHLRVGSATGAIVDGTTFFDVASNTIFWTPLASSPNGLHPAFPGEPLLSTGTAYTFVVTTAVRTSNGGLTPANQLEIPFTTIDIPIRTPAVTTGVIDLQLNEVLADPDGTAAGGDANQDGVANETQDEFVEIVNVSSDYLDLRDAEIRDAPPQNPAFIDFGTALAAGQKHQALLAPGRAIIVYGGGTPAPARLAVGRSKVFTGGKSTTATSTWNNNSGSPGGIIDTVRVTNNNQVSNFMVVNYVNPVPVGRSLVRNPDVTGTSLVDHTTAAAGVNFSPGLKIDGTVFP